jgi:RIO-like serine/threonine protein kinase
LSARVADKLYQQRKWGNTSVPFEGLVHMTRLPSHEVERAIMELRTRGFLDSDRAEQGQYSLNSAKRREIELLVKHKIKA